MEYLQNTIARRKAVPLLWIQKIDICERHFHSMWESFVHVSDDEFKYHINTIIFFLFKHTLHIIVID